MGDRMTPVMKECLHELFAISDNIVHFKCWVLLGIFNNSNPFNFSIDGETLFYLLKGDICFNIVQIRC